MYLLNFQEDLPQLPNVTVYLKQRNNEHANITDHNNIVLLDKIDYFKPSTSNSIKKKASKKVMCFYIYNNNSSIQYSVIKH